jgi:pimeloyl-ACP methyl ester carboxylesterase
MRCPRLISGLVLCVSVLSRPSSGQTPTDSTYRKFDEYLSSIRARNAKRYAITSASGIDEASYVPIGGIEQWVTIRGQDRANPVILFLHGGPGDVTNPWTFGIFAPWEEQFTMVQWDERGAGRTLAKTGPGVASTLTVDRMAQDGIELAEYLRQRLGKAKIILVGHSFGSVLALTMVRRRPDLFYAYVGTGQVADATRNYAVAYDALVRKARALGNARALADLQRVGPPPYASGDGYRVQWAWANAFEGADQFLNGTIGLTFAIPIFFFQGAEDFTTPTALARQYLAMIHAPRKAFVTIEGGGHFAVFMRPTQFLAQLVARVRPLAVGP